MYGDIPAALAALKTASDLTKLVLKAKVDSAVTQKAIELQSGIIELQSTLLNLQAQYQALLAEKDTLKQQLVNMENWEAQAKNYGLTEVSPGAFVYMINEDQRGTEPVHWLCAHCYENRQKSILQRWERFHHAWIYRCPACSAEIRSNTHPK